MAHKKRKVPRAIFVFPIVRLSYWWCILLCQQQENLMQRMWLLIIVVTIRL